MKTAYIAPRLPRTVLVIISILILFFSLGSAHVNAASSSIELIKTIEADAFPAVGKEYYLRHNIWLHKGTHITTNYSNGQLVPINSKVKLDQLSRGDMTVSVLSTGEKFRVNNVDSYSKKSMREIARNMLSEKAVDLDRYGKDIADSIRTGIMKIGMTKDQVLLTRGFPPAHKTPSLESDRWVYWTSRYATQTILFKDGKLAEGRGIRE